MSDAVLTISDVRKNYGRHAALRGVSLTVHRGELFGLLGPNGAGKTTLLSILSGLMAADSGEVRLFGQLLHPRAKELRRRIGLATQDLALYPELTAEENLRFFGNLYGLNATRLTQRTTELLAAVGLSDRAKHRAETFSGGMKRRLNLAIAVIHEPEILYLDEPTTGVDPQSRNHIFEQVKRFNRDGLTVIYTSHYMEEVQSLCPRVAILDQGEIRACDRLEKLLQMLDSVARFEMPSSSELLAALQALPGVKRVESSPEVVCIFAPDLAPILPSVTALCHQHGIIPRRVDVEQPSLERVFLHLTGHALRD